MVASASAPNTATSGSTELLRANTEPNRMVTVAPVVLS
jgi:hypothetical protein